MAKGARPAPVDACAVLGLPRDQGLICRYERGEASPRRERMVPVLAIIAGTEVPVRIITERGYDFGEVSSAMQKAIRRADTRLAGYWALELWHSGFGNYVWKRLLTLSAEDVWGLITSEIKALHDGYVFVNKTVPAKQPKGRIFISKAVILLCAARRAVTPITCRTSCMTRSPASTPTDSPPSC